MANEWQQGILGDYAVLVRDTVSPSAVGDVLYIGLEHVAQNTLSLSGVGRSQDVTSAKLRFKEDDILFGKLRPYFRKVIRPSFSGICSTDFWVIRSKNEGVDQIFLFYFLASQSMIRLATSSSEGTRMPRANWNHLSQCEVVMPPLKEQRAIAHILGTLDDKIELNRRMNETLEAMAQAIFKDWFVDFGPTRAKMEGRDPYLPPEIWNLFPDTLDDEGKPTGWERKPLDEIAVFFNGLALQKFPASDIDNSLPVIKIAELRNGVTSKTDRASHEVSKECLIRDGDFLFSWSGSLLARFWTGGEGALNQHLFKVSSDCYPAWFFSHWVYYHLAEFQAIAAAKATTMGHIQRRHLSEAMTNCPSDDTLSALGWTIDPLIERSVRNELEARTLAQTRDTLLPKLIAGEIGAHTVNDVIE